MLIIMVCDAACGDGCDKCTIETTRGSHTPTCLLCKSGYVLSGGLCLSKHSLFCYIHIHGILCIMVVVYSTTRVHIMLCFLRMELKYECHKYTVKQ